VNLLNKIDTHRTELGSKQILTQKKEDEGIDEDIEEFKDFFQKIQLN
jgi:hypothetical protein